MQGSACNGLNSGKYWTTEPTAIFVVWDDWGGWYDHIPPWTARQLNHKSGYNECDPTTKYGCGYTDGFRVPLLVVSPYTQPGTISGQCGTGNYPPCPNYGPQSNPYQYVHDFGSILAYVEWNFGFNPEFIAPPPGYADYNAPDWGPQRSNVPLSDFFGSYRDFTSILGSGVPYYCFQYPGDQRCSTIPGMSNWQPSDPDSY